MHRKLSEFNVNQIMAVYSGKDGACCCGCSGNYYYNPSYTEEGFKHRGYKITEEEIDIRKVSRIFNLMKKVEATEIDGSGVFHYTKGKRLYMCILPPSIRKGQ